MLRKPEARRVERHQLLMEVREINGQTDNSVRLIDISPLGAQLETGYPMAKKALVEFDLAPSDDRPAAFIGRVAWVNQIDQDPPRYRIGVCFINPFRGLWRILLRLRGIPGACHGPTVSGPP